jgi:bacteriocin biosynthesis cyclodehydratase domain-containing protein
MIARPRLKRHLHAQVIDDRVLLIAEGRCIALSGRAFARVTTLLDGRRTCEDIVDALADEMPPAELYHALATLERNGHVEDGDDHWGPGASPAFWSTFGVDARTATDRLASRRVGLCSCGDAPLAGLRALLEGLQVQVADPDDCDLLVVVVDDHLQAGLEDVNRRALASGRPWLIVKPNGIVSWLGPLLRPGETGCWECLAQRLRMHREVEEYARRAGSREQPYAALPALSSTLAMCVSMAATEVAKWIVLGRSDALDATIVSLAATTLETQAHRLVRRPQCPACGEPARRGGRVAPLVLRSAAKAFVADGGHRTVAPDETLRRLGHHVSPITGIVPALTRVSGADDATVHVYVAGTNLAVRHDSFERLRRSVRSRCCGKGVTDVQARTSALCESLERYSGVFRGEEITHRASLARLGDTAIDPRDCMLFSAAQYRDREAWNGRGRRLDEIPRAFDPEAEIDWTPAWSLTRDEPRYLATGFCYYSHPAPPERFFCMPESNGCAAGNTLEEAVLQGLLELVERDSVAIWWYNRLRRPAVDLRSLDDPFVHAMLDRYARAARDLWVLDVTMDLGVPAYVAVSSRLSGPTRDIIFAPAAHLDARLAITRALTELNQMLPGAEPGGGEGYSYDDPEANDWWEHATLAEHPYLTPDPTQGQIAARDLERLAADDLLDDVRTLQRIVESKGIEVVVLDQTRPDVGLAVVKVVAPGLRHFWARYAPGRLYDVPVEMGHLPRRLGEEDLNPVTIFI